MTHDDFVSDDVDATGFLPFACQSLNEFGEDFWRD